MSSHSLSQSNLSSGASTRDYLAARASVDEKIRKRIQTHQISIEERSLMIQKWAAFELTLPGVFEVLFVIFSTEDLEKLLKFEAEFVSVSYFKGNQFFEELRNQFELLTETEFHHDYVKTSVRRRQIQLERDVMLREILSDAWLGISTKSREVTAQLHSLFENETENTFVDYELRQFIEADRVFCEQLMYYSPECILLADGTKIHGIYKLTQVIDGVQYCRINCTLLNVNVFKNYRNWRNFVECAETSSLERLSEMPSFDKSVSTTSVPRVFRKLNLRFEGEGSSSEQGSASPSGRRTTKSDQEGSVYSQRSIPSPSSSVSQSGSSSSSRLVPYLSKEENPLISASPSASILEVASYCENRELGSNSDIPDKMFVVFEEENFKNLIESDERNANSTSRENSSLGVVKGVKSDVDVVNVSGGNQFYQMFTEYENSVACDIVFNKENMEVARRMIKWVLQIVEQQGLVELIKMVSKMAKRKLSKRELIFLMFFDRVKEMEGSASFLVFMLNQTK